MTVYLVISLPKIPYKHRINMVLANPIYIHGSVQPYLLRYAACTWIAGYRCTDVHPFKYNQMYISTSVNM